MNYDVFTVAAMVRALTEQLVVGKVQDTLEIGNDALGLEIYAGQRYYLLVSASPQQGRVQIVSDRVRRGVENPSPIGLMLRRYVEGGRLVRVDQPAWERVIEIHFEHPEGPTTLVAEIMDKRSNVLLVRDGVVMDCIRRISAAENRVRVSMPGQPYVPPPPQANKIAPTGLSAEWFDRALQIDPSKLAWKLLTESVLGFSPMLAKETVYRAVGDLKVKCSAVTSAQLMPIVEDLIANLIAGQFEPGITEVDGLVTSFAPYEVTHLAGWHPVEDIHAALSAYYGSPVGDEAYEAAKQPVYSQLADGVEKMTRRWEALQREYRDQTEIERLRHSGELLLAYQYQIAPNQTEFSAEYDFDQPPLEIKLDPKLTALDNAKAYFEQYDKAKRAAEGVPTLIAAAANELAYLRQLEADLKIAANWTEIGEVQDILQANGYWRGPKTARPGGGRSAPIKGNIDGFVVWVGRNARQNEDVTFTKGRPEDTWLHVRGVPGAHVVIKNSGRAVPPHVVERAAAVAAYYSPLRDEASALVDVTERRYVRKIKGAQAGMVTYRNETPVQVAPNKSLE